MRSRARSLSTIEFGYESEHRSWRDRVLYDTGQHEGAAPTASGPAMLSERHDSWRPDVRRDEEDEMTIAVAGAIGTAAQA